MSETHILIAMVNDKPGVMQRVSGLFRKRNFNIDSITVGRSEKPGVSRITLTVTGDHIVLEQVMKQLNKVVDVIKVVELDKGDSVMRELALVKIRTKNETTRTEVVSYANIFRGRIVDVSKNSVIVEITGDSSKIEAFVSLVSSFGVRELARTGVTAMSRGAEK
ncbi:MAG: acetolactate synthase small subunit [Candidatus Hydrothermarchaeota archaeon]|nr:acetolactate synthase small subunit [Candidatus Hydrothermarchaeota archaeon]